MTDNSSTISRHLPLEGSFNIRDLGGYKTADGCETRWRRLLRADGLHSLTAEAQSQLLAEGVTTIIDLRYPGEIEHQPNVFAGSETVQYLHLSLFPQAEDGSIPQPRAATLAEMYCQALDSSAQQIKTVFEKIAEVPLEQAVLFHCTAGKDRTGIIAALALALVGVSDETIAEDYSLTDTYLAPLLQTWRDQAARAGRDMAAFEAYLYAKPENMVTMLSELGTRYGSAEQYLRTIGLADAHIDVLRRRLLH